MPLNAHQTLKGQLSPPHYKWERGSTRWMKGIAEVGQLGRGHLHCKSRRNVKAKCRHALEEKCIVVREQNSEGPWALGSRPLWWLFFRKGAAALHCGRGCASLCKTVQHVIGCQYQVTQILSPHPCDNTLPFPNASRGQYKSSFSWKPLQ